MKKLKSIFEKAVLCTLSVMLSLPAFNAGAAEVRKSAEAAYGTPVIDGKIDEVWNTTNANIVENCTLGFKEYKGWVKALWDEDYVYFLSKVYSVQYDKSSSNLYEHDSVDIYIDENMMRTVGYQDDDYQVRSDFEGEVSGNNYPDFTKVKAATSLFDDGFYVEMAIPLTTITPKEGLTFGFEVLMNAAESLGVKMRTYNWNTTKNWKYNNTSLFGTMTLKKSVNVVDFKEPEWVAPKVTVGYSEPDTADVYEMVDGVTTKFDSTAFNYPILHINEYPAMAIENLAAVIGGTCEGNTLKKDNVVITFTVGSRLAEYNGGHLMLERAPKVWEVRIIPIPRSWYMQRITEQRAMASPMTGRQ